MIFNITFHTIAFIACSAVAYICTRWTKMMFVIIFIGVYMSIQSTLYMYQTYDGYSVGAMAKGQLVPYPVIGLITIDILLGFYTGWRLAKHHLNKLAK